MRYGIRIFQLFFVTLFISILLVPAGLAEDGKSFQSVEERRLYEKLLEEKNSLAEEQQEMQARENELKTLEASVDTKLNEIDRKITELKSLQKKIEALLAEKSEKEKARIKTLSAIYEKMEPDRAALALAGVDQELASSLLENMKPKSAAKILNMLERNKTSQISTNFTNIPIE